MSAGAYLEGQEPEAAQVLVAREERAETVIFVVAVEGMVPKVQVDEQAGLAHRANLVSLARLFD